MPLTPSACVIIFAFLLALCPSLLSAQNEPVLIEQSVFRRASVAKVFLSDYDGNILNQQTVDLQSPPSGDFVPVYLPGQRPAASVITILRKSRGRSATWNALVYPSLINDTIRLADARLTPPVNYAARNKEYKLIVSNAPEQFKFKRIQFWDGDTRYPITLGNESRKAAHFYLPADYGLRLILQDGMENYREVYLDESDEMVGARYQVYRDFETLPPVTETIELEAVSYINSLSVFLRDADGKRFAVFKSDKSYSGAPIRIVRPWRAEEMTLEVEYTLRGFQGYQDVSFFAEYDPLSDYIYLAPDSIPDLSLSRFNEEISLISNAGKCTYKFVSMHHARIDKELLGFGAMPYRSDWLIRQESYFYREGNEYYRLYPRGFTFYVVGDERMDGRSFVPIDFEAILDQLDGNISGLNYLEEHHLNVLWACGNSATVRIKASTVNDDY